MKLDANILTDANVKTSNTKLMPILKRESDIFPQDLLSNQELLSDEAFYWWSIYTISRREKDLMRRLTVLKIPFYGPIIPKRYRSPQGRMRTSYIPLFPNYIFMYATEQQRHEAMTTNCISRYQKVEDASQLVFDLRQVFNVVQEGIPLTPEAKLETGSRVRVRSGPFAGYEGLVVRREGKTRLLLSIQFLEQGVSMEMDEGLLEAL